MPSTYYKEQKILIEASYINNLHREEKVFCSCYTFDLWVIFFLDTLNKIRVWGSVWVLFEFPEKRRPNKYCLSELNVFFYM